MVYLETDNGYEIECSYTSLKDVFAQGTIANDHFANTCKEAFACLRAAELCHAVPPVGQGAPVAAQEDVQIDRPVIFTVDKREAAFAEKWALWAHSQQAYRLRGLLSTAVITNQCTWCKTSFPTASSLPSCD